jgi:hypothetical protein
MYVFICIYTHTHTHTHTHVYMSCCYIRGLGPEYLPTLRGAKEISKFEFATIYSNIYVLVLENMCRIPRPVCDTVLILQHMCLIPVSS